MANETQHRFPQGTGPAEMPNECWMMGFLQISNPFSAVNIGERNPPLATGDDPGRNGERNGHERNGNETEHIDRPGKIGERNPAKVPTGYDPGRNGERNGNERNGNETQHMEECC